MVIATISSGKFMLHHVVSRVVPDIWNGEPKSYQRSSPVILSMTGVAWPDVRFPASALKMPWIPSARELK